MPLLCCKKKQKQIPRVLIQPHTQDSLPPYLVGGFPFQQPNSSFLDLLLPRIIAYIYIWGGLIIVVYMLVLYTLCSSNWLKKFIVICFHILMFFSRTTLKKKKLFTLKRAQWTIRICIVWFKVTSFDITFNMICKITPL